MPENIIHILVLGHASLGGIALLSGLVALIAKKGSPTHKAAGKVFFWSLLTAGLTAMLVAVLPGHKSPFLLAIGIFSIYLIVSGYLALRYKQENVNFTIDRIVAIIMLVTGLGMIIGPWFMLGHFNIVLSVFGGIGLALSLQDLHTLKTPEKLKKNWMSAHLGKMIGGYIAATTAFIVVNQLLPGIVGWLAPTVLGIAFINYWSRKVKV